MIIVPVANFDFLKTGPRWFVLGFLIVYLTVYAGMLATIAYVVYEALQ